MIPYFEFTSLPLGPIAIQVWGFMVALGIVAAVFLMRHYTKKYSLSEDTIIDMALWALVSGFVFARIFHVVFYHLDFYLQYPGEIVKFWHGGASSLGGFFGALLAIYIYIRVRRLSFKNVLPYFDIAALGLWLGWGMGRIGCFLIHDHPGTSSDFVLAVGGRHDLGLYESLLGFALFIIFALLFKRLIKLGSGYVAMISSLSYAIVRFGLDFLRATDLQDSDVRYALLTPAQWGMLVVVAALTSLLVFGILRRRKTNTGEIA